jgi:hypothetical protein
MNFQYYETLLDKSEKNLFSLVEKIVPAPLEEELGIFLKGFKLGKAKDDQESPFNGDYIKLTELNENYADLSKLNSKQLKTMYETFISREKNDKIAVKWRFFQFLRFQRDFQVNSIHIKKETEENNAVDLILENRKNEFIPINCSYILEKEYYDTLLDKMFDFSKQKDLTPEKFLFSCHKTYRDIPIQEEIAAEDNDFDPEKEIWVEWTELEKPFNGEDLLIVLSNDKKDLEIAGFNFSSIQNLLDYVYKFSNGGQISIYRQPGFFSKKNQDKSQIELIWKGIMLKNKN